MLTCTRSALEARAISSVMIIAASQPISLPPYSSGMTVPKKPSSPIGLTASLYGKWDFRSHSSAKGAIFSSANERTVSRNIFNSSVNSKFISPLLVDDYGCDFASVLPSRPLCRRLSADRAALVLTG